MKKNIFVILIFSLVCTQNFAQNKYSYISDSVFPKIRKVDTNTVYFHADIHQFFYNTEYFNPIVEGFTLPGTSFRPGFFIMPSPRVKVYAGIETMWYDGDSIQMFVKPDFYISYLIDTNFWIQIGTLQPLANRQFMPMMQNAEDLFTTWSERGIEIKADKKRFYWNIFVDWMHFLHPDAHSQEHIHLGNILAYHLINNSQYKVSIPLHFTAYHEGGQINDVWMPDHIVYNNAFGIQAKRFFSSNTVGLDYFFFGYKDGSSHSNYPFTNGYGNYISATFKSKHIIGDIDYWNCYHYYSPFSEPIYTSVSQAIPLSTPPSNQNYRSLITAGCYYQTHLAKGVNLLVGGKIYYDAINKILDYSYELSIRYSADFLVAKNK